MLAKVCLKRFRFVLYAALFFLITLHITDRTNSGLIATICIWFALPLAFIAVVWWHSGYRPFLQERRCAGGRADVGGACRLVGSGRAGRDRLAG